jgi:hypothetical protein
MAVTATPIFIQTPRAAVGQISTANTNRDGTGTIGTIWTAGANGSLITGIDIQATGTTTAGVVRLFIHDGTNARLWREVLVSAITPSTTVAAYRATLDLSTEGTALWLSTGYSLRASTHNAETFNVTARGGDF